MTLADAPTVFVIDDDASVRDAIHGMLKSVGLRSETFASPQEFLRSKHPDGPSCLVLDVRLPGVSGLDFQRELADAGASIPIIFITGHGDIPMTVKAMKSGAVEFLTKPFIDTDLLDAIHQALDRDRSYLLNEAVDQFLSVHEYHLRQIREGLAQARAGKLIDYEQVKADWQKRLAK